MEAPVQQMEPVCVLKISPETLVTSEVRKQHVQIAERSELKSKLTQVQFAGFPSVQTCLLASEGWKMIVVKWFPEGHKCFDPWLHSISQFEDYYIVISLMCLLLDHRVFSQTERK